MIYLDNAATTQPYPEVIEVMEHALSEYYGNPSSTYRLARLAKQQLDEAKNGLARSIQASPDEIILTSGGTEANNTALYALANRCDKKHIVTTSIEHPSVFNVMKDLEQKGFLVTYLTPDETGCITVEQVEHALREDTSFVSVMMVNNETGARQPIASIGELLQGTDILFHTDAVQAYGTVEIDVTNGTVDMLSVSAHKIHGPKGIGFLYVKQGTPFEAYIKGGGQEQNRRSGTENLPAIVGFAKAVEFIDVKNRERHFRQLQETLLAEMDKNGISYLLNGTTSLAKHSPKIVNLWLKGIPSSKLLIQCDLKGIMLSAGSACSAGSLQPSRVIEAIYQDKQRASESIRLSFSLDITVQDIQTVVETLKGFTL